MDGAHPKAYTRYERGVVPTRMKKPTAAHLNIARRLIAHEADVESDGARDAEALAAAAGRVHQKIFVRLSTLVGREGARALFGRSVRLSCTEFPCLAKIDLAAKHGENPAEQIATGLLREAPDVVMESTVVLCATLLSLLTTLIGDKLTALVLKKAWPAFDPNNPQENA